MPLDRRKFLQTTVASLAGSTLVRAGHAGADLSQDGPLRVAVLGSGLRGQSHIRELLGHPGVEVTAIADIDSEMVRRTHEVFDAAGEPRPTVYDRGPEDYRRLLQEADVRAVIIATPWRWHTVMAVAALHAGMYTGLEVGGAFSLDECWELVRAHEESGSHLYFLENVCYRRDVMAVLNMARAGVFGELLHLEGGYQHDLRTVKFNDGKQAYGGGVEFGDKAFHEARWRTRHSVHRNGDLYPTHGLGPAANLININRGNRFVGISSMATKARGLHQYVVDQAGPDHPNAAVEFKLGDVVTSMLSTQNGEVVVLHHDTNLPRPYSLGFRVQGTKGLWMDINNSVHIEGESPEHQWEPAGPWLERYDHPYWRAEGELAAGAGHGGMDYFLIKDFVRVARANTVPPIDVYDAATWLAVTPLSEQSVATGGALQAFPDFTRGRWMDRPADFATAEW
ncbi:Alpha-N-acetylgalactosaminidase [Neolewinella maritima]|uniref:Alpha-N-acetylgalactosaminidase n=1 Tax=Neolewinella maritima TaxID=1383882 RepID=A0ABN8F2K0_9BACT|nr:Gfo/Idh/MocA family oxidoreductase [Neolewinella maritima]CAH0998677.1 Alpha-N-acetylgalactosaminidase [Neolewinella maritima]